jgi:hypothetical protein
MDRRSLGVSAQQLDPLSWFTGRVVPLVFAALIVLYGLFRVVTWFSTAQWWLQPAAIVVCASACIWVFVMTRPSRRQAGWLVGAVAVTLGGAGLLISAVGYARSDLSVELWWAPFGLALAIASLAPYLSLRRVLVLGTTATVISTVLAYVILDLPDIIWGPISTMLIIASPVICGEVAAVVFSYVVVSRMLPVIEQRSQLVLPTEAIEAEAEAAERLRLARLSARAVPFLEGIVAGGSVSAEDRALAGQIARRLRDDLVTQSNLTWLDAVAADTRLVVIDPERRAERMRPSQRTALGALLRAVSETPGVDSTSLLIELRGRPDGATAIAVSLDVELPEGRRIMHLAPYWLTLGTAVDDLRWDANRLSFTVPD